MSLFSYETLVNKLRCSARSVCARTCLGLLHVLLAPQKIGRYREESSQGKFSGFTNINRYDKLPNTYMYVGNYRLIYTTLKSQLVLIVVLLSS